MDALRVTALAACRLSDADAVAGLRHLALPGFSPMAALLDAESGGGGTGGVSAGSAAEAAEVSEAWSPEGLAWFNSVQLQVLFFH